MSATKQYELVYIVAPEATEQQLAELHELVVGITAKFNGTIDRTVPIAQSEAALAGMQAVGIPVEHIFIPNVDHSFIGATPAATRAAVSRALARSSAFRTADGQLSSAYGSIRRLMPRQYSERPPTRRRSPEKRS